MTQRQRWKAWFKKLFQKLNNPPGWVALLTYATAFVICPLTIASVLMGVEQGIFSVIAYAVSVFSFLYMAYITVLGIKKFRKKLFTVADKFTFTRNLHKNYEFRTLFFAACSFLFNVGYTVFLAVMAVVTHSGWYGALAVYYILLSTTRGGVLIDDRKNERKYKNQPLQLQKEKLGSYRYSAVMLLLLTTALSFSVAEMVKEGQGFRVPQGTIYAFAAFALFRIALAIYNFIKSTKYDDLTVRAVRHISLATALASVLSLQTAIFAAFPPDYDVSKVNAITGMCVCLFVVLLGLFMIIYSIVVSRRLARCPIITELENGEAESNYSIGYNRAEYCEEYGTANLQSYVEVAELTERTEKK